MPICLIPTIFLILSVVAVGQSTHDPNPSISPGQSVHIHGVPKGDFSVNFLDAKGNMVFHFNPRFSEKAVVRNGQTTTGEWDNEEREGKFPFKRDKLFSMVIENKPYGIQVYVDGKRFCGFTHRVDPPLYRVVEVQGDIDVTGLEVR